MAEIKTLLVVEDNEVAREALAVLLQGAGYAVAGVSHGREALDYLRTGPRPHLILLDMLLPVLDGWEFLEILHREAVTIPVIVTTGTIISREWAKQHGCAGFVRKPIDPNGLLTEVRQCLA